MLWLSSELQNYFHKWSPTMVNLFLGVRVNDFDLSTRRAARSVVSYNVLAGTVRQDFHALGKKDPGGCCLREAERVPFSTSGRRDRPTTSFLRAEDDTPEKELGLTTSSWTWCSRWESRIKDREKSTGTTIAWVPVIFKTPRHFLISFVRNVHPSVCVICLEAFDEMEEDWNNCASFPLYSGRNNIRKLIF